MQALLDLSSPFTSDKSSSTKSRRELAPFFTCLIKAKSNKKTTNLDVEGGIGAATTAAANLRKLLHLLGLTEDENTLTHQILLQENNQAKKLLVILFLLDSFASPLDGFASLWELILVARNENSEKPIVSFETFEASLDTCLVEASSSSSSSLQDSAANIISLCQEFPFKASTGSTTTLLLKEDEAARGELRWYRSCRTLAKLYKALPSHKNRILENAVVLTTSALRTAVGQNDEMMLKLLLKPLTDDLLPLLLVDGNGDLHSTHQHMIWNSIWALFQESVSSNATLIAVTTVLCIMLPSCLDKNLPVSPLSQSQLIMEPPIRHLLLWKLIHQCLGQGLSVPRKSSWVHGGERKPTIEKDKLDVSSMNQLLRRRGLYLLGLLVEGRQSTSTTTMSSRVAQWRKYVASFETLEMEFEPHLVDQVWPTVSELFEQASAFEKQCCKNEDESSLSVPPVCSWDWLKLLLSRIVTSEEAPVLRKLSLYRLFKGQVGIQVDNGSSVEKEIKNQKRTSVSKGAPLSMVTPDFLFDSIIPSYNTLASSVGLMMHTKEDKKVVAESLVGLMDNFVYQYVRTCVDEKDEKKTQEVVWRLLGPDIVCELHRKTTVQLYRCISGALKDAGATITFSKEMLQTAVSSFKSLFSLGSLVQNYKMSLLEDLASILAQSRAATTAPDPRCVLDILAFYPEAPSLTQTFDGDGGSLHCGHVPDSPEDMASRMFSSLRTYVRNGISTDKQWAATAGATLSAAFVDGSLLPRLTEGGWNTAVGTSVFERTISKAIVMLCTLAADSSNTASEFLWPAVNKGLGNFSPSVGMNIPSAGKASRALLLLEKGCTFNILSGMGNGDLVVDSKTEYMMPPPPQIELLLLNGFGFIHQNMKTLLDVQTEEDEKPATGSSRSDIARRLSSVFASLMSQLEVLHRGFPSSVVLAERVNGILESSVADLLATESETTVDNVISPVCLLFAALSSGGAVQNESCIPVCGALLRLKFIAARERRKSEQAFRSIIYFARWGSLSILLKQVCTRDGVPRSFLDILYHEITDSVESIPTNALGPFFESVLTLSKLQLSGSVAEKSRVDDQKCLTTLINVMLTMVEDSKTTTDAVCMLDRICSLIFQHPLLLEEESRLRSNPDSLVPLRNAFRRIVKMSSTRPYIAAVLLTRAVVGWIGPNTTDEINNAGKAAIPYLHDIAELAVRKDLAVDEAGSNQVILSNEPNAIIPEDTHAQSLSRGLILMFLSKLPAIDILDKDVLRDFVSPLIQQIFDAVRPVGKKSVILGTPEYCIKIRGWQALCVLSRFITREMVPFVRTRTLDALGEPLHGQVRYFIEIFTIRCCRLFPSLFVESLVEDISRTDLSLQKITSLMIICGNLIVGRYQSDFMPYIRQDIGTGPIKLKRILSGVIPWLSSTQGFSRAIAQLLAHKLIPLVVNVDEKSRAAEQDWCLLSLYNFLENNSEMKRLRKKQSLFFESYEVDEVCTPEHILTMHVDEGGEAYPMHLIDAIKLSLQETYDEAHTSECPSWKQVEDILQGEGAESNAAEITNNGDLQFQRKIIPLDALNLALEDIRERRHRNLIGRRKQDLIVCASLIDKIPNLGGLARTAEIFAADRLVVPDKTVAKTDNFRSFCVGAGDWIDIEECKEKNLLNWLRKRKEEGFFVVGLEQTSSSVPLTGFRFPKEQPVILLLGKEKEGIPIQYLQAVDQCVEIPQLGIIRSLNVHVSGAIAIWEYTRQNQLIL